MQDFIHDIDSILDSKQVLSNDFGRYSKIYLMTTENIKGFLQQYDLANQDILTVTGSGDQMLNAFLMGAGNVTCFDINPLAFLNAELKKAAISTLSYSEFISFFFQEFQKFLDVHLYEKIRLELKDEALVFFDYLYSKYGSQEIFDKIYYRFHTPFEKMKNLNFYLEESYYEKLADILKTKKVTYLESNITNLREYLTEQFFDMVLLSNISDSIDDIWEEDALKNFKRCIHSLSKSLKSNGTIQVGYIYNCYSYNTLHSFHNKKKRQTIFTTDEFHTTFVEGFSYHDQSDAIITFQKMKKRKS